MIPLAQQSLWEHNQKALDLVMNTFKYSDFAVVVQPMASGKSSVMLGLIRAMPSFKRVVVVEPINTIEQGHRNSDLWDASLSDRISYITYSSLGKLKDYSKARLHAMKLDHIDLLVLDEVHHLGAPVWTQGFHTLRALNPTCKVLGLTATPIRYLDGATDVGKDFFEGNVIESLNLIEGIKTGVYANPVFVSSIYDPTSTFQDIENKISVYKTTQSGRFSLYAKLNRMKQDWAQQEGLGTTIEKYVNEYQPDSTSHKFIVFMEGIPELKRLMPTVASWFTSLVDSEQDIIQHYLYSDCGSKDEDVLAEFARVKPGKIDLLFTVNKLNEGVHVPGISGVIMLRNTISPNLYYQQLGRALSTKDRRPLVFDFVNNIESIKMVKYMLIDEKEAGLEFKKPLPNRKGAFQGVNYTTATFHCESQDFISVFETHFASLGVKTSIWEDTSDASWFQCLSDVYDYMVRYKKLPDPRTNPDLGVWLRHQLVLFKSGALPDWRVDELASRGIKLKTV